MLLREFLFRIRARDGCNILCCHTKEVAVVTGIHISQRQLPNELAAQSGVPLNALADLLVTENPAICPPADRSDEEGGNAVLGFTLASNSSLLAVPTVIFFMLVVTISELLQAPLIVTFPTTPADTAATGFLCCLWCVPMPPVLSRSAVLSVFSHSVSEKLASEPESVIWQS